MPTRQELLEEARRLDVPGRNAMSKDELAFAVAQAQATPDVTPVPPDPEVEVEVEGSTEPVPQVEGSPRVSKGAEEIEHGHSARGRPHDPS